MAVKKENVLLKCIYCGKKITWEETMETLGDGFGTCQSCGNKMDAIKYEGSEDYFKND